MRNEAIILTVFKGLMVRVSATIQFHGMYLVIYNIKIRQKTNYAYR